MEKRVILILFTFFAVLSTSFVLAAVLNTCTNCSSSQTCSVSGVVALNYTSANNSKVEIFDPQETIVIDTDGTKNAKVKFTSALSGGSSFTFYFFRAGTVGAFNDTSNKKISVIEGEVIGFNEYIIVDSGDFGRILQLDDVSCTGSSSDYVQFKDVVTSETYKVTTGTDCIGTLSIDGQSYYIHNASATGTKVWVSWGNGAGENVYNTGAETSMPKIKLKSGNRIAFGNADTLENKLGIPDFGTSNDLFFVYLSQQDYILVPLKIVSGNAFVDAPKIANYATEPAWKCLPETQTCTAGWKCKDANTKQYQNSDCSWTGSPINCQYGCENGACKCQASKTCLDEVTLKTVTTSCSSTETFCPYGCSNGACLNDTGTVKYSKRIRYNCNAPDTNNWCPACDGWTYSVIGSNGQDAYAGCPSSCSNMQTSNYDDHTNWHICKYTKVQTQKCYDYFGPTPNTKDYVNYSGTIYWDYCGSDTTKVYDYACDANDNKIVNTYTCAPGSYCKEGACVEEDIIVDCNAQCTAKGFGSGAYVTNLSTAIIGKINSLPSYMTVSRTEGEVTNLTRYLLVSNPPGLNRLLQLGDISCSGSSSDYVLFADALTSEIFKVLIGTDCRGTFSVDGVTYYIHNVTATGTQVRVTWGLGASETSDSTGSETTVFVEDTVCSCKATATCTDSDGGRNYYVKGTATAGNQSLSDHCSNDYSLTEKFCSSNEIKWETYDCPYGCKEGACILNATINTTCIKKEDKCCMGDKCTAVVVDCVSGYTPVFEGCNEQCVPKKSCKPSHCTDSDGGQNYYKAGHINSSIKGYAPDKCADDKTLIEQYCTNEYPADISFKCPNGCKDGACFSSPEKPPVEPAKKCVDSDGGKSYYVKGATKGYYMNKFGYSYDSCLTSPDNLQEVESSPYLGELYCRDDINIDYTIYTCLNGCKKGACIKSSEEGGNVSEGQCNGCFYNGKCLYWGIRVGGKYCSISTELAKQKLGEEACDNNFECESNVCVNSKCLSQGFIQKVLNLLRRIFGMEEKQSTTQNKFLPTSMVIWNKGD